MSILKICHYEIKEIPGKYASFYYLDREVVNGKSKLDIIKSNREIKIESLVTGDKEILNNLDNPNNYDEFPSSVNMNFKSVSIEGEILSDIRERLLNILKTIPISSTYDSNKDDIRRSIFKVVNEIYISGYGNSIGLVTNPLNINLFNNGLPANIEIFYDDIIPKDKIFLFNKPDSHNIGIKIYRSDIYYYVFENKINDAIKLIEIK